MHQTLLPSGGWSDRRAPPSLAARVRLRSILSWVAVPSISGTALQESVEEPADEHGFFFLRDGHAREQSRLHHAKNPVPSCLAFFVFKSQVTPAETNIDRGHAQAGRRAQCGMRRRWASRTPCPRVGSVTPCPSPPRQTTRVRQHGVAQEREERLPGRA